MFVVLESVGETDSANRVRPAVRDAACGGKLLGVRSGTAWRGANARHRGRAAVRTAASSERAVEPWIDDEPPKDCHDQKVRRR